VPYVSRATSAALAVDLATGDVVFARNTDRPLAPASNEKLAVTYAALEELGADYRIETDVLGDGALRGTTWRGRLYLQGHGDPTLSTSDLYALARRVRAAGIRRVAGGIIGDESFFDSVRTAPGWKPSFYINESPPLSALTVDRARYGYRTSRTPALTAAFLFRLALMRSGVAVTGGVGTGRARADDFRIGAVRSPSLAALLRFMDHESDNFTAELLLKQLSAMDDGSGTTAGGARVVRSVLAEDGIPTTGLRIADGSGLSLLDRLTTRSIVGMLRSAWGNSTLRPTFVSALAVAGLSGTLKDRLRTAPARGNVRAKTGTTDQASALSGFVRSRWVFSVLQNGRPLAIRWARRAQDRFVRVLASQ
jgi:D-alanyl-D-alanine carboxypeptidase/D-alanyl-D-alanine-endopeptidase (penicillin-binding protein 4)